jgi:hypothetical protein
MLHLQQESFIPSLLMQPPITVVVQSSRSTKVFEQLSTKYELIQKEISATKTQVEKKTVN